MDFSRLFERETRAPPHLDRKDIYKPATNIVWAWVAKEAGLVWELDSSTTFLYFHGKTLAREGVKMPGLILMDLKKAIEARMPSCQWYYDQRHSRSEQEIENDWNHAGQVLLLNDLYEAFYPDSEPVDPRLAQGSEDPFWSAARARNLKNLGSSRNSSRSSFLSHKSSFSTLSSSTSNTTPELSEEDVPWKRAASTGGKIVSDPIRRAEITSKASWRTPSSPRTTSPSPIPEKKRNFMSLAKWR